MNTVQKYYCVYVCIDKRYVSLCQFTSRQEAELMRQKAIARQKQYTEKNFLVMTPAEVGTLVDDSLDPRDISATLVDLAVKGYIKIEDVTREGFLRNHHDYVLHLQKPMTEWDKLAAHERAMLAKIFGAAFYLGTGFWAHSRMGPRQLR